jgi:hypothetical protein
VILKTEGLFKEKFDLQGKNIDKIADCNIFGKQTALIFRM